MGPQSRPLLYLGDPCSMRWTRGCSQCPRVVCRTVCWVLPLPGGLSQPCPPHSALQAQAFAAQGSGCPGNRRRERRIGIKITTEQKTQEVRLTGWEATEKGGCLHTRCIFLHLVLRHHAFHLVTCPCPAGSLTTSVGSAGSL